MKPVNLLRDIREPESHSLKAQAEAVRARYEASAALRRQVSIRYTAPPVRNAA